ncbi:hypothetical protein DMX02_27210 [Pseudomonas jessenii]|nr:hypothetical protein DMX02_27210 [Pseudomonas jessenii]
MDNFDYIALDLDKNLKPLSERASRAEPENHFQVKITPTFPPLDGVKFKPNHFIYGSLTSTTISIIARQDNGGDVQQFALVVPRAIKNGTHPLSEDLLAVVLAGGVFYRGQNGSVTLEQVEERQFVKASFEYQITYNGDIYKFKGELLIKATAPL